jgi:hypothetical protein
VNLPRFNGFFGMLGSNTSALAPRGRRKEKGAMTGKAMGVRRRPLQERVCRALCEFHGNPQDTKFEAKPMWESYRAEAEQIIEGSGIVAFLGVVREAMDDPSMPTKMRENLKGALAAFEGVS